MPKEQILGLITAVAKQKSLSREEVLRAYDLGAGIQAPVAPVAAAPTTSSENVLTKQMNTAELLYYIGGAIVCVGIGTLVAENWSQLSDFTRVFATLGSGLLAYCVGLLFNRDERTKGVGTAFFLISGIVLPMGLIITYKVAGLDFVSREIQVQIGLILFLTFSASFALLREAIFVLFSIIFGTWLFVALTDLMVGNTPIFANHFYEYQALAIGAAYLLLAISFAASKYEGLSGFLFGFGTLGFLGSALSLGGWSPHQNAFWELIFPGLVFGGLFAGVYLKSRSMLTFSTLFLMLYIMKLTGEYFAQSLGWPLALVLAGLTLIGVGYMSLYLNKKYM